MDIAIYLFIAGVLVAQLLAVPVILSLRKNRHIWKVEALEMRSVRANDEIDRKVERDLLLSSRSIVGNLHKQLGKESRNHSTTLRELRDEKRKVVDVTEALAAMKTGKTELARILIGQRNASKVSAKLIEKLLRKINAIRGADTARANRLGPCEVVEDAFTEGFYAVSKNKDSGDDTVGPTRPTKWQARRSFESIMGLRGKIIWEDK